MLSMVGWFLDALRPRLGEVSAPVSVSSFRLIPVRASAFLAGLELLLPARVEERVPAIVKLVIVDARKRRQCKALYKYMSVW